jgi:hypothetical protein
MFENGKMRHVKTILRMWQWGTKKHDEGVNLTKIYCKHFCECHNNIVQQLYDNKNLKSKNKKHHSFKWTCSITEDGHN